MFEFASEVASGFSKLSLVDLHSDVYRNIISIQQSQDLFDDLSAHPEDWLAAQAIEMEIKPPHYQSNQTIIHRPFEEAEWFNAIEWPFQNWRASRFSDGSFGVWYGCESVETSVMETAYHWLKGFLQDAGFENELVTVERKIYQVRCDAALIDLRPWCEQGCEHHSELMHKSNYHAAQAFGARVHHEGHPGLMTLSVRREGGQNVAIFNPRLLSQPRYDCQLSYHLRGPEIIVEKQPGVALMRFDIRDF